MFAEKKFSDTCGHGLKLWNSAPTPQMEKSTNNHLGKEEKHTIFRVFIINCVRKFSSGSCRWVNDKRWFHLWFVTQCSVHNFKELPFFFLLPALLLLDLSFSCLYFYRNVFVLGTDRLLRPGGGGGSEKCGVWKLYPANIISYENCTPPWRSEFLKCTPLTFPRPSFKMTRVVRRLEFYYYLWKLTTPYSILIPVTLSVQSRAAVHFFAVFKFFNACIESFQMALLFD